MDESSLQFFMVFPVCIDTFTHNNKGEYIFFLILFYIIFKHLLLQDKTKLLAQVEAQDSVISGLKAERKLWGQELAQQGKYCRNLGNELPPFNLETYIRLAYLLLFLFYYLEFKYGFLNEKNGSYSVLIVLIIVSKKFHSTTRTSTVR